MHKSVLQCFGYLAAVLAHELSLMHTHVFTCLKSDDLLGVHATASGSSLVGVLCRQGDREA